MNAPHGLSADADTLNLMKFGIGQPVPRQEDPTLLKGQGRYTDDMTLPNQAYAVMVRSQVAHGVLKGIDIEEAKTMPGVLGVWTGADLNAAGYGPLKTLIPVPNRDGTPMKTPTLSRGDSASIGSASTYMSLSTAPNGKITRPEIAIGITNRLMATR